MVSSKLTPTTLPYCMTLRWTADRVPINRCALLAACSSVMDDALTETTPAVVATSLRGFANAVHIAAEFGMHTERDAFVTMLAKYTYLESTVSAAEEPGVA